MDSSHPTETPEATWPEVHVPSGCVAEAPDHWDTTGQRVRRSGGTAWTPFRSHWHVKTRKKKCAIRSGKLGSWGNRFPGVVVFLPTGLGKLWAECVTRLNLNIEKKNTNGYGHSWLPKTETIYDSICHSICPKHQLLTRSWFFWTIVKRVTEIWEVMWGKPDVGLSRVMGVPQNHPSLWDFPWNKPSFWGYPHDELETPMWNPMVSPENDLHGPRRRHRHDHQRQQRRPGELRPLWWLNMSLRNWIATENIW